MCVDDLIRIDKGNPLAGETMGECRWTECRWVMDRMEERIGSFLVRQVPTAYLTVTRITPDSGMFVEG